MNKAILLIHPDSSVRSEVRALLSTDAFRISEADELHLTDLGSPDAVLIDWREFSSAADTIDRLKRHSSATGLRAIVLAERCDYTQAVRALETGADDCVGVPLEGDELLVRLNACLGRPSNPSKNDQLAAGPIVLDRRVHRVTINDQRIELAPTEFRLLAFLLEHQGRVFSRNELLIRAWSRNVKAGQRTVDVHVRRLRQQLEPFRCEDMLQTVRGFGYRFRADDSVAQP